MQTALSTLLQLEEEVHYIVNISEINVEFILHIIKQYNKTIIYPPEAWILLNEKNKY